MATPPSSASADMPSAVRQLPHGPGVYRFVGAGGRVLYVGRASDLRRRVASYWGHLGDRRHLLGMVCAVKRVQALACASEHEAAWLERNLLERHKPRANRSPGGQEVPMLIALSGGDAGPGLKAVHSPCTGTWRHFGPYLGGDRARLAVSALDRVYALAYTGQGLTGSERDMARARGVTSLRRAEQVQAVSAVLEREPTAVARFESELTTRRDAAAAALAFELARRVQDELTAIRWVVSPQRITSLEPYDLDFYGWDNGPLVHFSIRQGRLSKWRESRADAQKAKRLISDTPSEWAEFARENAALAARLASSTGTRAFPA